ncbi:MAG: DinB family protein [Dehalococcoidia bacterium]|nr:DinB family protein [Dehalococcoidia bacterium]
MRSWLLSKSSAGKAWSERGWRGGVEWPRQGVTVAESGELVDLREKLDSHRRELLRLVRGLTEEAAAMQPNGEWSVKQQLAHAATAERVWRDGALLTLSRSGGLPQQWAAAVQDGVAEANKLPIRELVSTLERERRETLHKVASLSAEQLQVRGPHPAYGGEMSVLQMLRAIYRHDRMHSEQVQGQPTTFQPRRLHARSSPPSSL